MRTCVLAFSIVALAAACDPSAGPLGLEYLQPGSGSARGGEEITVVGQGFVEDTEVWFGDVRASTSWYDTNTLVAFSPPGIEGAVDVRVVRPDGAESTAVDAYEYVRLDPWFAPTPAANLPVGGTALYTSAGAGDIDGDGDEDLFLAGPRGGIWRWENTDRGRYVGAETLAASADRAVVEDFDGDGFADLFACGSAAGTYDRLWAGGEGGLSETDGLPAVADRCRAAVASDLDGDGRPDLVLLGEDAAGAYVRVLRNRSAGSLSFVVHDGLEGPGEPGASGEAIVGGNATDVTLEPEPGLGLGGAAGRIRCTFGGPGAVCGARWDGPWTVRGAGAALEIIGGGEGATLVVELVDGDGETFVWSAALDGGPASLSFALSAASSDDDGVVDEPVDSLAVLAVAGGAGPLDLFVDTVVLRSDVGPIRVEDFDRVEFALRGDWAALAAGDVDVDGDPDLVLAGPGGVALAWQEPGALDAVDGQAGFTLDAPLEMVEGPVTAAAVLPGAGFADILCVTGAEDRLIRWSGGPIDLSDGLPFSAAAGRVAHAADLDRDGVPEGIVGNDQDRDALWHRGASGWEPWTVRVPEEAARTVDVVSLDVEPDGDLDLFLLNEDAPHRLLLSEDPPAR